MESWAYAIIAAVVCFAIIKLTSTKKKDQIDDESVHIRDGAMLMFLVIIFVALSYWYNSSGGMNAGNTENIKMMRETMGGINKEFERNMVNSIRQDVNVSFEPF